MQYPLRQQMRLRKPWEFHYIDSFGGVNATTLPVPMLNLENAGAHSSAPVDIQEFLVMPVGAENFFRSTSLGNRSISFIAKID